MEQKWITPIEVAGLLKVSAWTVRQWVRTGKLKASRVKASRRILISEKDLNEFIKPISV